MSGMIRWTEPLFEYDATASVRRKEYGIVLTVHARDSRDMDGYDRIASVAMSPEQARRLMDLLQQALDETP